MLICLYAYMILYAYMPICLYATYIQIMYINTLYYILIQYNYKYIYAFMLIGLYAH